MRPILRAVVLPLIPCLVLAQAPGKLNLVIVEGEGAINNVKQRTVRPTIVEVQDENHKPVGGVAVTFLLPNNGPGGVFTSGAKSATIVSDSTGRAAMPRFQPNSAGQFQIHVNASHQGNQASLIIAQSNVIAAGAAAAAGGGSLKLILIIGGIAAAGAAGAAIGLTRGGGGGNNTATIPSGAISGPGTGVVGAPR
jgi:hypothetical protein